MEGDEAMLSPVPVDRCSARRPLGLHPCAGRYRIRTRVALVPRPRGDVVLPQIEHHLSGNDPSLRRAVEAFPANATNPLVDRPAGGSAGPPPPRRWSSTCATGLGWCRPCSRGWSGSTESAFTLTIRATSFGRGFTQPQTATLVTLKRHDSVATAAPVAERTPAKTGGSWHDRVEVPGH